MNGRSSANDYVLVPARAIDDSRLIDFAGSVWPEQRPNFRVTSSWWRRAEPNCAIAAVHQPTGAMAGLCGGRPCQWTIAGRTLDAIAICDWYVASGHTGQGLGKRLVQHFDTPDRFLYAFSISDAAIANFKKLGWTGPHRSPLMVLPLPRLAGMALSLLADGGGVELMERELGGGDPLGALGTELDHIDAARGRDPGAHMRRGASDWSWRLSICGGRRYRFCIARRADEPVGYVVVRRLAPGQGRQLDKLATAIITDLVAVNDDPKVLRALALRAVAIATQLQTTIVLATISALTHQTVLTKVGFVSPAFPMIGRFLGRRSPQFMWLPRGAAAALRADEMMLTFADVAIDLDL